jgi:hypothetical protein
MQQGKSFVTVPFALLFSHTYDIAVTHKGYETDKEEKCKYNSAEMVYRKRSTWNTARNT